jgi:hypothetical protein
VAKAVRQFMSGISLVANSSAPSQNPNYLINERGGMMPELQPPAYVETQDWRVINNENLP